MIIKLIRRHYQATVKRGKITSKTRTAHFLIKMFEEDGEMYQEISHYIASSDQKDEMIQETIDSVMVRLNFLQHINVDVEDALLQNTIKQETRKD